MKGATMADPFSSYADSLVSSARAPYAVVPHDANELPIVPKSLYIGTGGTVVLRGVDGAADVTYKNVASGDRIYVRASHVRATGTTAQDIVAEA